MKNSRDIIKFKNLMKYRIHILVFVLLALLHANLSLAEDIIRDRILRDKKAHWQISAERLSYIKNEGLYIADGDVVITREGQRLSSAKAKYNENTGIVEVTGNVRLEVNGDILTGERGIFDLNNHNGQITKGLLFLKENHYYISGDVMEKTGPDTYRVRGCRLTTCDGSKPDWSITGSQVEVTVEGYGTVKNAVFKIRDFPVFYLPYAIFPVKTRRQTGLLPPRIGYSSRNGMDTEVPFFWAISDQMDATFYERYMGERGFMQGLEYRYVADDDSKGIFLFDILSDRIENKDVKNPDEAEISPFSRSNTTRYWLRSMADQQFPSGIQARLDTDFVSDQDYLKEFYGGLFGLEARPALNGEFGRPMDEIYSPTRRSALRLSRDGQDHSLQALASYYQRPENPANDQTPQPLGGMNFTILPRPLPDLPLFLKFDTDYDYIWRDWGQKGHRLSFTPELSYPMWVAPYLEFEPSINFTRNTQWLDETSDNFDQQSQDVYDFRTRLSTILERTFDFEMRNVKRLKHKFSPSLIYEYRSHKDEDRYRPWFEAVDWEGDINRITLALDNLLDARKENDKGEVSYAQWGTFSLSQGYNPEEARRTEEAWRGKQPLEPLRGILTLEPFSNLKFDSQARWDYSRDDISFADLSLELSMDRAGGRKDSYEIDYRYYAEGIEYLNYRININLLYGFSTGTALKRDLTLKENLESIYWVQYDSQCWRVRLIAGSLDGIDSVMVTFGLKGIGDL
ncbi:MAG: LPS assembly protein LptD [Pseudomonadota bacterium]